ncbi:MAG: hypothetical protein HY521_09460 [Proteobacteria bacterium]|nr:hypothetical protein [Pseudomonadota bacterium]
MSERRVLLDPTDERATARRERAARPKSLEGLTIGLLDIAKVRGDIFIDRLDELLRERGHKVRRYKKATNTRVAALPLRQQIAAECNVVIEALSD